MTIYYTEEEFEDVVIDKLADAFYRHRAIPDKDLTRVYMSNGEVNYAIRGKTVLRTKCEDKGFVVLYPKDPPF